MMKVCCYSCSFQRHTCPFNGWRCFVCDLFTRKANYLIRDGRLLGVQLVGTAEYWDPSPNIEASETEGKRGGYQWAGGWINPAESLLGGSDHPTMSDRESADRFQDFNRGVKAWKMRRQLVMGKDSL